MDIITGMYLKELRESHGLSQTNLSNLTGISQAHRANIENEKVNPRLSTVNVILSVLMKKEKVKPCKDIMSRKIVRVALSDPVEKVIEMMKKFSISQVPVFQRNKPVGSITEMTVIKNMGRNLKILRARDIIEQPFPIVNAGDPVDIVRPLLEFHSAVLIAEKGKIVGIISKANLLRIR